MKLRFQVHALNEALDVASIVPPRSIAAEGGAGYLFIVKNKECWIYSREQKHQIRVSVPLEDADGDGAFVFPAEKVGAFKFLEGWIQIESGHEAAEDRYWLKYEAESKDKQEDISTIDPRLMQSLDEAFQKSTEGAEFPAALLRDAITVTKPYLAKPGESRVEEHFQTLQLFDASKDEWKKGNGVMFAADGIRACYYSCDKLQDRGLALHGGSLPFVSSFLSKCSGNVQIRRGKGITFLATKAGHVLGWAHSVQEHGQFKVYSFKSDGFVFRIDKVPFVKALKYVRAALDAKRDKVRLEYSHDSKALIIRASEGVAKAVSRPIVVEPTPDEPKGGEKVAGASGESEDFAVNINLNHLIDLVDPMRSHRIELRVAVVPPANGQKASAFFRTIDAFYLDEEGRVVIPADVEEGKLSECKVIRFMPSRE